MARSRLRWWLVRLAVAGLVLAGLAAASSLAVRAYAPALSRDRLESALTEALGRPVRIEAVALSLWRGGIEITRLRVEPGAGEGPEPILQVARAGFRVGISSLWRRELVLSTILLQDAILRISGPGRDATPFALDVPDTFALGPITVRLGTLKIERGRATYRDDTRGLVVDIHDLNLTARPVRRGIDFEVRLSGVSLQTSDFRETIADVEGAGWIHQDRLAIRKVSGRWQERRIQATGEVRRPFATAELDLSIEGEADLASLSRRFAPPWPLAGVMTAQATVQGPLDTVEVSGRLAIPRLSAGPIRARDVAVRGRWKDGFLDLSQVTAGLFDGTLRGTFATRVARPQETRAAFTLQRASIPALDTLAPTPLGLRGELDAEAEITGDPRRPEEMRGRVLFSGTRIILPGELSRLGPGSVRIAGSFQDAVADVSQATASWPGADVTAGGRVGPEGPLGLRVALRANLDTIAPLWGMPVMSGQADAQVEAHGRWAQPGRRRPGTRPVADRVGRPTRCSGHRGAVPEWVPPGEFGDRHPGAEPGRRVGPPDLERPWGNVVRPRGGAPPVQRRGARAGGSLGGLRPLAAARSPRTGSFRAGRAGRGDARDLASVGYDRGRRPHPPIRDTHSKPAGRLCAGLGPAGDRAPPG